MQETYKNILWMAEEFNQEKVVVALPKEDLGVSMPQMAQIGGMHDNNSNDGRKGEPGVIAIQTNTDGTKTKKAGRNRKDYFHCSGTGHWVGECLHLMLEKRLDAMKRAAYRA